MNRTLQLPSGSNQTLHHPPHICSGDMDSLNITMVIVFMMIMIIGILGNALVCFTINVCQQRRQPYNLFITNLALGDIGVSVFVCGSRVVENLRVCLSPSYCAIIMIMDIIVSVASVISLVLIAIDRYVAIKFPYLHGKCLTNRLSKWLCLGVWIYSAFFGILVNVDWQNFPSLSITVRNNHCNNINGQYILLLNVVNVYLPLILLAFVYIRIAVIANHHKHQLNTMRVSDTSQSRMNRRTINATITLTIIYLAFVICWAPSALIAVINYFRQDWFSYLQVYHPLILKCIYYLLICLLPPMNSIVNPIIYAVRLQSFREGIRRWVQNKQSTNVGRNPLWLRLIPMRLLHDPLMDGENGRSMATQF